jgi:cysteine desulfurase
MRMRSGTENVAAVVGMGQAIEEIFSNERIKQNRNMEELRNNFITQVLKNIPGSQVTGSMEKRLINNVHFRFPNVEAYNIVVLLDQKGIAASVGSACSEKTQEPSHVLLSMGLSSEEASSAVRFTLGKYTTTKEIKEAVKLLAESVTQLQKVRV